jgi:hypothetical protein
VKHEGGRSDLRQQMRNVEVAQRALQLGGDIGRGAPALELVETFHLLRRSAGNEQGREELSESRVVPAPALPDQSPNLAPGNLATFRRKIG